MTNNNKIPVGLLIGIIGLVAFVLAIALVKMQSASYPDSQPVSTATPSPSLLTSATQITEKSESTMQYRNEKWGLQFEFSKDYKVYDNEVSFPETGEQLGIHLELTEEKAVKDNGHILPSYNIYVDQTTTPEIEKIFWWPYKIKPREEKSINGVTWRIYNELECKRDAPNKRQCHEQAYGIPLSYITIQNNLRYRIWIHNPDEEHSQNFQNMTSSVRFFTPQQ